MSWHSRFVDAGVCVPGGEDGGSEHGGHCSNDDNCDQAQEAAASEQERLRVVEETLVPGASVALVARAHGVNANQVFAWRKLHLTGKLIDKGSKAVTPTDPRLLPVTVSDAGQQLGAVAADATMASAPILCNTHVPSGSIHIQFPKAQVRVEGCADASALRVLLECLLR